MRNIHRILKFVLLFCFIILLSYSCKLHLPSSVQKQGASSTLDCRVIDHDVGQTKVCGQARVIVALSPYILDMMLALKVEPIGYAGANLSVDLLRQPKFDNPREQIPYLGSRMRNQPINLGDRHTPSLEAIARLQPDLILGEVWQGSQSRYSLLSQIAPTVLVDDQKAGWQHSIKIIANALNRSEELQEVLSAYDARVIEARDQLDAVSKKYPQVLLISSGSLSRAIYLYDNSEFSRLLEALNFQLTLLENTEFNYQTGLSTEVLPQLNADIIIVVAWNTVERGDEGWVARQQEWSQTPLLQKMPASQGNRVFFIDGRLSTIRGPLASEAVLRKYLNLLVPLRNSSAGGEMRSE